MTSIRCMRCFKSTLTSTQTTGIKPLLCAIPKTARTSAVSTRYYTNQLLRDKTPIDQDDVKAIEFELDNLLNHTPTHTQQYTQSHHSTGIVTQILSDVIHVTGLQSAHLGAYVRIQSKHATHDTQLPTVFNTALYGDIQHTQPNNDIHIGGIVIAISDKSVIVATCASNQSKLLHIGATVTHYGELPAVRIDTTATNTILNAAGVSTENNTYDIVQNSIHAQPLSMHQRSHKYDHALITGNLQIDFFHPIALGLNIGLFGSHNIGKTSLMLDILGYQTEYNKIHQDKLHIVYCSINNVANKFDRIVQKLQQSDVMPYTTVFKCDVNDSLLMQYLTPFTAVTHAEALRAQHKNVLIVYDNLSTHATIYEALTKRIELPLSPISTIHAKLLERTAQIIDPQTKQTGSITSFVLCETNEKNIESVQQLSSYVDHRIVFSDKLRKVKLYPAISVASVLGKPAARFRPAITRTLTTQLSQLITLSETTQASYDWGRTFDLVVEEQDQAVIEYIDKVQLLMHQLLPMSLCDQFITLYTASNQSLLSEIELKKVPTFVRALINYIKSDHSTLYKNLQHACSRPNHEMPQYISDEIVNIVSEFEQMFRKQD